MLAAHVRYLVPGSRVESLYTGEVYRFSKVCEDARYLIGQKIGSDEEVQLEVTSITPADKVRFIAPHYKLLFEVKNLECVLLDGEIRRVIAFEGGEVYHFGFDLPNAKSNSYVKCWHICEFAEKFNPNGDRVKPIKK